jgi:hypothetical protein
MKIYKVKEILKKLEYCIEKDIPFSHIRFGDGGLKYMAAVMDGDFEELNIILEKEGMPYNRTVEILELWGYYARQADFIDTPQVYIDGLFWPRIKGKTKDISNETSKKLLTWKDYYSRSEIDNENYCNPESNYLMTTRLFDHKKNLLDVMKGKKICIISARPAIEKLLRNKGYDVDLIQIVRQYEGHYDKSFKGVIYRIREEAQKYDFWLVAAGELGRIYSGLIKEHGGRTIDIGFVIEFWLGYDLHPRLEAFLKRNPDNPLETILTKKGKIFRGHI